MPLLKLKLNVCAPPTPSTTPSATTTPLSSSPPSNLQHAADNTARYKILYRTSGGTLLNEDVSSDARLTAIYAHNALPSQQVYSYARARVGPLMTNLSTTSTIRPTDTTTMGPPSPPYRPNQPPSYVRAGTCLDQWAGERALADRLDKARHVARLQTKQARKVGGLVTALEARLEDKARQAGSKLDFRTAAFLAEEGKKKTPCGWKKVVPASMTSPMGPMSRAAAATAPAPSPTCREELGVEERPAKRVRLTLRMGGKQTPSLTLTPASPPVSTRWTSIAPAPERRPNRKIILVLSSESPSPTTRMRVLTPMFPPPSPPSPPPPAPSASSSTRGRDSTSEAEAEAEAQAAPDSESESESESTCTFKRPLPPMPLHARLAEPPRPPGSHKALCAAYVRAFDAWDRAMCRDVPGYAADVGKRTWFTRRLDGPKRSFDVENKKGEKEKDITRSGKMRMMKRKRKRDGEEDGDDN